MPPQPHPGHPRCCGAVLTVSHTDTWAQPALAPLAPQVGGQVEAAGGPAVLWQRQAGAQVGGPVAQTQCLRPGHWLPALAELARSPQPGSLHPASGCIPLLRGLAPTQQGEGAPGCWGGGTHPSEASATPVKPLLSPTCPGPCPQSHSPALAGPHRPAPALGMLQDGAWGHMWGCWHRAPAPYTPGLHLGPHKLIAHLLALAAKPSQNSWLLILRRLAGARRFTTSTSCSPPAEKKDSGPHSRPSSLFCSPETRTGCRGSGGQQGQGGPWCHHASPGMGGGSPGPAASAPGRACSYWHGRGHAARAAHWVPGCSGRRGHRGGSARPPPAAPGSSSPPRGR